MTGPARSDQAGRTYLDLQNKARRENRPTQELLDLYVLEGFLTRLAASDARDSLVLKGGALLAAFGARRPTRDVDFLALDLDNDRATVLALAVRIAAIPMDDGLVFDADGARAELIRDDDEYSGVRVSMRCGLAQAELAFHIDVNIGDPVWPAPRLVEVPGLLHGSVRLLGYPVAAVHAEKIVTALQRGTLNTRWRDFADIYLLLARLNIDGGDLTRAIELVAAHRGVGLTPLADVLQGFPQIAQVRWAAWIRRQRLDDRLPGSFADLLADVCRFADPALRHKVASRRWDHTTMAWEASHPDNLGPS
ncbi:MAG: nucleotidyl transferase AbiEii/AbiGii toxin family protein [Actinobacteria bacterium]|nr:nucleotidyl transferase AbiEii/AbiGii toxin family protein [Actinomycetota bacterium]